jgi:hypothetical protein
MFEHEMLLFDEIQTIGSPDVVICVSHMIMITDCTPDSHNDTIVSNTHMREMVAMFLCRSTR